MADLSDEAKKLEDLKKAISLEDFGGQFGTALTSLEVLANNLNKTFGQTRERIYEIRTAAADSVPKITRLGGDIVDINNQMRDIAVESRRNTIATTEQMEKMFATMKVTGIEVSTLTKGFIEAGYGLNRVGKEMESVVNYVRSIGGNVSQISRTVTDNLDQLNRFQFEKGVVGLTKMAAQASMLRFDMSETFNFADKVMNPEGAVAMAAAFQRLGVAAGNLVDPFALMNQSILDPSGLQDSLINIGKQFTEFNKETGKFEISREGVLRLREIENEAGLARGSLSKAGLAAAELDSRLSQISPSIKFKSEEDKQYLANLGRLGEKGQYEVELTPGSGLYTNLSELNQNQIDKLIEQQKRAPKSMEDIARAQMRFDELAAADLNTIKNTLLYGAASAIQMQKFVERGTAAERVVGGAITEQIETKSVRKEVETFGKTLTDVISNFKKTGDVEVFEKAATKLESQMEGIGTKFSSSFRDAIEKAKTKESGDSPDETRVRTFLQNLDEKITNATQSNASNQSVPSNFVRGENFQKTEELKKLAQDTAGERNMTVTQKVEFSPWNINVNAPSGVNMQQLNQVLFGPAFQSQMMANFANTFNKDGKYGPRPNNVPITQA